MTPETKTMVFYSLHHVTETLLISTFDNYYRPARVARMRDLIKILEEAIIEDQKEIKK